VTKQPTATTVRLTPAEHATLTALAAKAGVSLSDACKHGARLYLDALTAKTTRRGRPPKGRETTNQERVTA
jgi:hypothetical protein